MVSNDLCERINALTELEKYFDREARETIQKMTSQSVRLKFVSRAKLCWIDTSKIENEEWSESQDRNNFRNLNYEWTKQLPFKTCSEI